MEDAIGRRVLAYLDELDPPRTHKELAQAIGMTTDAFSRAINDKRSFSSVEITRLADELDADLHWLITGEPDPNRVVIAARHACDAVTMKRSIPEMESDHRILESIWLAYRQAYISEPGLLSRLPSTPASARNQLGHGFVRWFVERLESGLLVEVVRIADLSTAYSFTVCGHRVIALPAIGNWFHENWSLAHELAHLALDHHMSASEPCVSETHEAAANGFAAELLMPRQTLAEMDWFWITAEELARRVWDLGVSTKALSNRLNTLGIERSELVDWWAAYPTQRLLRRHGVELDGTEDQITVRMDQAAQRRFPVSLQERHLKRIATGELGKQTLAWMMDVDPDRLEVDVPPDPIEVDDDTLSAVLGFEN